MVAQVENRRSAAFAGGKRETAEALATGAVGKSATCPSKNAGVGVSVGIAAAVATTRQMFWYWSSDAHDGLPARPGIGQVTAAILIASLRENSSNSSTI